MEGEYATLPELLAGEKIRDIGSLMQHPEGKRRLIEQFDHWAYLMAVRQLQYREIGIVVEDDSGEKIGEYASHNGSYGMVEDIVSRFEAPNITVRARERDLMEMLRNVEWIKEHPVLAFLKYQGKFTMQESYWHVLTAIMKVMMGTGDSRKRRTEERSPL